MKRVLKCIFCLWVAFLMMANAPPASVAQEESGQAAKGEVEKKRDLGEWWHRNPLTYNPVPEEFLYHFEATYSWDRVTGNFTSDKHDLGTLLSLRKKIFTYNLRYAFDKRNVAKPKDPPNQEENRDLRTSTKHEIHNDFRIALTKRLYGAAGSFWLEDDYIKIDKRLTYYGGMGANLLNHPRLKLDVFGAYGYEEKDRTSDYHDIYLMVKDWGLEGSIKNYEPGTQSYSLIYLAQSARAYLTRSLALNQSVTYFVDPDENDRYRWKFNIGLDIKLTKHILASISYEEEYDNDADSLLGVLKRDATKGVGIKISF